MVPHPPLRQSTPPIILHRPFQMAMGAVVAMRTLIGGDSNCHSDQPVNQQHHGPQRLPRYDDKRHPYNRGCPEQRQSQSRPSSTQGHHRLPGHAHLRTTAAWALYKGFARNWLHSLIIQSVRAWPCNYAFNTFCTCTTLLYHSTVWTATGQP